MEDIKKILQRRAESIGTNQLTAMEAIKKTVFDITNIEARVIRLKHNTATLAVDSSSAANEIRLCQTVIINKTNRVLAQNKQLRSIRVIVT